ncbi:peptidyl-tRNA hydrolase II [Testicularia cyperi]|uniref:peptidyl-tRNA hydrolase n=1 Tax=Testicularia cyperi TaxID=1882483 RepID=A0A317XK77_9BASI|nr:peptidyl-tRNA hydrolase II [Testicularia cyperi]
MSTTAGTLSAVVAVGIGCLTIGYWAGVGSSMLSYNQNTRSMLSSSGAHDDDDDDENSDMNSDDELRALADQPPTTSRDNHKAKPQEECKMILVVRTDIKMEKGKIAAQCSHATLAVYKSASKLTPGWVRQWERLGQAKVAVKCPDESSMLELEKQAKLQGVAAKSIIDAGRTQIAPNTRTVLGIGPAPISIINQITGHLKLL